AAERRERTAVALANAGAQCLTTKANSRRPRERGGPVSYQALNVARFPHTRERRKLTLGRGDHATPEADNSVVEHEILAWGRRPLRRREGRAAATIVHQLDATRRVRHPV